MNRHAQFLEYLKKIDGDLEFKNVTRKLNAIGLRDANNIYEFLNNLHNKGFIEWHDNRPRINSDLASLFVVGGYPDQNAPLNFEAKILLPGLEYLDERKFKENNNRGLYISIAVAVFFGIASIVLTYSNNEKEIEIRKLKEGIESEFRTKNSIVLRLKSQIKEKNEEVNYYKKVSGVKVRPADSTRTKFR